MAAADIRHVDRRLRLAAGGIAHTTQVDRKNQYTRPPSYTRIAPISIYYLIVPFLDYK